VHEQVLLVVVGCGWLWAVKGVWAWVTWSVDRPTRASQPTAVAWALANLMTGADHARRHAWAHEPILAGKSLFGPGLQGYRVGRW